MSILTGVWQTKPSTALPLGCVPLVVLVAFASGSRYVKLATSTW